VASNWKNKMKNKKKEAKNFIVTDCID